MNFLSKSKKVNDRVDEYKTLFIKESYAPPARFGKSIYIQKGHHERISQIVSVIGTKKVTLYDYLDNVLNNHFREFDDEISQSFREKIIFK